MRKVARKCVFLISGLLSGTGTLWAQGPKPESSLSNPFVLMMVAIIVVLALIIILLGRIVTGAAITRSQREKKESESKNKQQAAATLVTIFLVFFSGYVFAQDKPVVSEATESIINGLSSTAYYAIIGVIFLEMLIITVLLFMLKSLLNIEKVALQITEGRQIIQKVPKASWWDRFNKFKPIHQEADIDLGHDYDGIRELDNRLPPWWLYGFYISIIVAAIYLYRYHIAHSAPLPREQYELDVLAANKAKQEYLKKAANNVDETTVKLLKDPASIAAGKQIFETTCFPCHGKDGQGIVGPNLTDDYWLHGGTINDVFKTIKYGYPDKGMKSWKDDFSPIQIAELASFVKSLHGTNPPNPKAPQGTLYTEESGENSHLRDSTKEIHPKSGHENREEGGKK